MGSGGSMAPCTASRESLRRLFFFSNSGQWQKKTETKFSSAPEVMNLFLKKIFCKDQNFQFWRNPWDAIDSVWEVGTQTRDPSPTFLSFIWHTSCQMRPVSDVMRQNREPLSDVRPALCSDHCGADFDSDPKPLSIPVSLPFKIHHHISGLDPVWL